MHRCFIVAAALCATTAAATDAAARRVVLPPRHRVLASGACDLSGTYTDRDGNVAALAQHADLTLNATSLSASGWTTARGALSGSTSAWMVFNTANLTAVISVGCTRLSWSNGAVWTQTQPNTDVSLVHVVFMTHLDIGFTLLARDVCDQCVGRGAVRRGAVRRFRACAALLCSVCSCADGPRRAHHTNSLSTRPADISSATSREALRCRRSCARWGGPRSTLSLHTRGS